MDALLRFLHRSLLVPPGVQPRCTPLTGGVSSDIWLVEGAGRPFCVKRALPRLRVAAEWTAPVERNTIEAAWLRAVEGFCPGAAPRVLALDAEGGMFALEYLDPSTHSLWKQELREGRVSVPVAAAVGRRLARIHREFARVPSAPDEFATDATFHAIRLEPYLVAAARAHPDRAGALHALVETTARTKRTVVHGDVSPKNILVGPDGPVFLDAECAWFGDPAFDAAFCLNHLLLKCLWVPTSRAAFLASYEALASAYLSGVDWEPSGDVERRTANLLPGLLLARVDGKSPVEYLTDDRSKDVVRLAARALLADLPDRLVEVEDAWAAALDGAGMVERR